MRAASGAMTHAITVGTNIGTRLSALGRGAPRATLIHRPRGSASAVTREARATRAGGAGTMRGNTTIQTAVEVQPRTATPGASAKAWKPTPVTTPWATS